MNHSHTRPERRFSALSNVIPKLMLERAVDGIILIDNPGLTTVRQPLRQMGALAAETVVGRLEQGARAQAHRTIKVAPELVVRGTTRALA